MCYSDLIFFQLDDGTWIEDKEQTLKIKADYVISAFGSTLADNEGKYHKIKLDFGVGFCFRSKNTLLARVIFWKLFPVTSPQILTIYFTYGKRSIFHFLKKTVVPEILKKIFAFKKIPQ